MRIKQSGMLGAYNIDSDDDEEEEEVPTNVPKSASTHIKELEKVSAEIVCYERVLNLMAAVIFD